MKKKRYLILSLMTILLIWGVLLEAKTVNAASYTSNDGTTFQMQVVDSSLQEIYDYADLFTAEEEEELLRQVEVLEQRKQCDIIILTLTEDEIPYDAYDGTETTKLYTEQFCMDNGFSDDRVAYTLDMHNRVIWTMGTGTYDSDEFVELTEEIYNKSISKMRNGNYAAAAEVFLDEFRGFQNPLSRVLPTFWSLVISVIAVVATFLGLVGQHAATGSSKKNVPPIQVKQYRVLRHNKIYRGTRRIVRQIPKETKSGGGRSGSGFSGGRSRSGGFSRSGGRHSGGGGKF